MKDCLGILSLKPGRKSQAKAEGLQDDFNYIAVRAYAGRGRKLGFTKEWVATYARFLTDAEAEAAICAV